jgi:hypothetical protein
MVSYTGISSTRVFIWFRVFRRIPLLLKAWLSRGPEASPPSSISVPQRGSEKA